MIYLINKKRNTIKLCYRQKGFVLPLAVALLTIATTSAAYFAQTAAGTIQDAEIQQANTAAQVKMYSVRSAMLFRLATQPITSYGLGGAGGVNTISLDNRVYQVSNDILIQLQDNRGLININSIGTERLARLLNVLGVPPSQQAIMIDTLADYVDPDNLKHLNGAEEMEYRTLNLLPPRNAPLVTPFELKRIIGWREQKSLWKNDVLPMLTATAQTFATNPTTAPWQVLATIPGVTPELAKQLVQLRSQRPLSALDVANILALPAITQVFEFSYLPANSIRIIQRSSDLPLAWCYSVTLTPMDKGKTPWKIDYFYRTVVTSDDVDKKRKSIPPLFAANSAQTQGLFSGAP